MDRINRKPSLQEPAQIRDRLFDKFVRGAKPIVSNIAKDRKTNRNVSMVWRQIVQLFLCSAQTTALTGFPDASAPVARGFRRRTVARVRFAVTNQAHNPTSDVLQIILRPPLRSQAPPAD